MKKKKTKISKSTTILIVVFFVGLSLLLYPTVSNWWNSFHSTRAISSYAEAVSDMSKEEHDALWNAAVNYNKALVDGKMPYTLQTTQKEKYEDLLNVSGIGIMGYIEIPILKVSLPIYHGAEENVLQVAVGHLEWSSLPVGGESTHCVLSGHRGLPSARLFTDLDKLKEGDIFELNVLGEVLTYEVDKILIVEPEDVSALSIVEGEDYCTLVTCTPYGINTHRLLVRGHRIANVNDASSRVTSEALQIDPMIIAPAVALPILIALLVYLHVKYRKKR